MITFKEFRNMAIDLDKARKNKIFKRDVDEAEKLLFALIRDGYSAMNWNVNIDGWELRILSPRKAMETFKGNKPLDTLKAAVKYFGVRL